MSNDILYATRAAVERGIAHSMEKMNLRNRDQVYEARRRGDCTACDYLRYGIAQGVAEFIGSMDNRVKAVYIYDELEGSSDGVSCNAEKPRLSPGIRVLVWVSQKSPALSSLVDALAEAVEKESSQIPCPGDTALCHQLDVILVDDQAVERRSGYGALISSLYLRPIEIWHREEAR